MRVPNKSDIKAALVGGGISGAIINIGMFAGPWLFKATSVYATYAAMPITMFMVGACAFVISGLTSGGIHYCAQGIDDDVENLPEAAAPQAGYEAIADSVNINVSVEDFLHGSPISQPNADRRGEKVAAQPKPEQESWWPTFSWK